jgi:uncharacterized protein YecT (DUF1311 family)
MKAKRIIVIGLCFISTKGFSQSVKDLDILDSISQTCADTAQNVLACEFLHYKQMDSILNVVYKKVKASNTIQDFDKIKNDQKAWLITRDKEFKKIDLEKDCDVSPDICQSLKLSRKTDVVRKRIEVLLIKVNH